MPGLIALVGGDEFRSGCEPMDRAILDVTGSARPALLVIPTAAASSNPSKAADNGVSYLSRLGAKASALMVLDEADANDGKLLSPVDSADLLYFTGGDPAHLLATLEGSLLLTKMKEALDRGAVVAGSSAGAMVMGSWMRFGGWVSALGITPGVGILPHHEQSDGEEVSQDLGASAPEDLAILGIDAKTGCLVGGGTWGVVGAGSVTAYHHGHWRRFTSGDVFDPAGA